MLTSETKRRIDSCRDILVGKLPLPTDQVELITLALIYKFMDDLDEESVEMGGKRSFFTQHLEPYRWRNLLPQTVSAEERMSLFARGIELLGGADMEIEVKEKGEVKKKRIIPAAHLPGLFRDVFRNAFLKFRDGRILTLFLTEVNAFAYSHSEELGNAFEYLLQCMGTQGENGQFRTPRHIIDFVVACLDPQPGDRILDPACGTGGFLVSAYKHILSRHTSAGSSVPGDQLTLTQRQQVYENLTGYDITDLMVKLSKVNLFLHGFPDPAIHIYDTLSNDARWEEKADLILANPPFMTPKGGVTPHTKFRIAAKKAEVLFTDYIAEHLSSAGRGGVIVPNGIVATTQNAYVKLRRFLVEDCLVAVVSLPSGVFKPYSGVKTSILFFDKQLARKTKDVLFLKITADGFDLGDKRSPVEANDLPEAERVVKTWIKGNGEIETKLEWKAVSKADLLARSDASLSAERFMGVTECDSQHPVVRLRDVCAIRSGGTPSRQNTAFWTNGTTRWISSKHIGEDHRTNGGEMIADTAFQGSATNLIPAKSLLLITRVSVGKWAFLEEAMAINQDITALTPADDRLLPEFLKCVAPKLASQIDAAAVGVGVRGVTREFVGDLEIPLPPLEEQRRIVSEVERYQKVLDGSRQILAGYQPDLQIDPEWEMTPLGEIAEVKLGKMLDKNKHTSGLLMPYLRNVNVRWGSIETHDLLEMYYDEDELDRFGLKRGDVLVCEGGEPGRSAVWDGHLPDLKYQKALHRVRFKVPYEPKMLVYFLQALSQTKEWEDRFQGATIKHFTREMFIELPIPLLPLEEQRRIVSELDAEAAQMEAVRSLIPRFEGKIQRVLDRVWGTSVA